jgi:uncharacterized protein (UPF0335 family)
MITRIQTTSSFRPQYLLFSEPTTLDSPIDPNMGIPRVLKNAMIAAGLPTVKPVPDYVHWSSKEIRTAEERRERLSERLANLEAKDRQLEEKMKVLQYDAKVQRDVVTALRDDAEEHWGVLTRGLNVSLRDLIQFGLKDKTIINKTVRACNEQNIASGRPEIQTPQIAGTYTPQPAQKTPTQTETQTRETLQLQEAKTKAKATRQPRKKKLAAPKRKAQAYVQASDGESERIREEDRL